MEINYPAFIVEFLKTLLSGNDDTVKLKAACKKGSKTIVAHCKRDLLDWYLKASVEEAVNRDWLLFRPDAIFRFYVSETFYTSEFY